MNHTPSSLPILVYTAHNADAYASYLQSHGYENVRTAATPEAAEAALYGVEVVIGSNFPTQLLQRFPGIRWLQLTYAGVDYLWNHPDVPAHVHVTRIVDCFSTPMAEYVFAYLLYVTKDIRRSTLHQEARSWTPFLADSLAGKTIGVAGLGSIGREIVRKARAFDMRVFGLSRTAEHADLVDKHFGADAWTAFVRDVDMLVVVMPLTPDTEGVIDGKVLAAMKDSAIFVNIGRGRLVVERDLIQTLEAGRLRAAVLDVFEQEPLPEDSPLWQLSNVLITPHMSGPSTLQGIGPFLIENLARYLANEPLQGVVDLVNHY